MFSRDPNEDERQARGQPGVVLVYSTAERKMSKDALESPTESYSRTKVRPPDMVSREYTNSLDRRGIG